MNELMKAYIDSYEQITIIMNKTIANYNKSFYLVGKNLKIKLNISDCVDDVDNLKYIISYDFDIELNKEYYITDNDSYRAPLYIGRIIRETKFDELYKYDGPLGVEYHKNYTIFRLWTPVAKKVLVVLNKEIKKELQYMGKGLWEIRLEGDYELYTYNYIVKVFKEEYKVNDPYAFASSQNHDNYIIDFSKLYQNKYEPNYYDNQTKAVIYEASIRDLTSSLNSSNKGTYLGVVENNVTESGLPTGLDYLSYLGITHLQLLPVYSFGGIDEINKDEYYNWGYNPVEMLVPSGWYSKHPYDPYSRINELRLLVDEANKRNIKVIMDVVFNHVYNSKTFPFDILVPGYFYRHVNNWGINTSGCGNDLASEKYMCRRFIIDCLTYYTKVFKMSGFRFDLMGILDIETMNQAKDTLLKINPNLMIYGEGWDMNTGIEMDKKACMSNYSKMPGIGFFNDTFRDTIKGSQGDKSSGYAFGGKMNNSLMYKLLTGSCIHHFRVGIPRQSINYTECHDNYTFYDFGKYVLNANEKNLKDYGLLALQIGLISNGIPFIHAGQEFLRTKQGVENSYMSSDKINSLSYSRRDKYIKNVKAIKDLIEIRKEYPLFMSDDTKEISRSVILDNELSDPHHIVIHHLYNDFELLIIIKNNQEVIEFEYMKCIMIYNSRNKANIEGNKFTLKNIGVYIFLRR